MASDPDFELTELAKETAANRMRQKLSKPAEANPPAEKEQTRDKAEFNREIGATAKAMLDMGIPPQVVAQYLQGSSTPPFPVGFGGGANQGGLTLTDVLSLVDRLTNQNKSDSDLTETLKLMREEIRSLKSANVPAALADPLSQLEQTINLVKRLREVGIIQEPSPAATATGEPIEVTREKNRHAEKMEEIQIEKTHKESIADALLQIPEALGAGLAERAASTASVAQQRAPGAIASTSTMRYYDCGNCRTLIPMQPDDTSVTCPKCGAVWTKPPETEKNEHSG